MEAPVDEKELELRISKARTASSLDLRKLSLPAFPRAVSDDISSFQHLTSVNLARNSLKSIPSVRLSRETTSQNTVFDPDLYVFFDL